MLSRGLPEGWLRVRRDKPQPTLNQPSGNPQPTPFMLWTNRDYISESLKKTATYFWLNN